MAVYDINGNQINTVYDVNGTALTQAYDINGNPLIDTQGVNLKVMSYNCGQWLTGGGTGTSTESTNAVNHRALMNTILSNQNADILCLQEYWGTIGSVTARSILEQYFPYVEEVNASTAYYGHAVCSKYPISGFSTTSLGNNRYLDRFSITVEDLTIEIFNCHLDTSSHEAQKVAQAEAVFDIVKTYNRFILCGDFNTVCKSVNDEEYTTIMKQFIDAGFHSANCSAQHGFIDTWTNASTASGTWYPCDQIITSANILIDSVWTDNTKLTDSLNETIDHIPLIAEVTIS